jgi:hypothetical protein
MPKTINVYMGSMHVSPVSRLWKTNLTGIGGFDTKKKEYEGFTDFENIHKMNFNLEETAEEKIEKQALLEALFQTQIWMEPYVKNPFIYITDADSEF